MATSLPKASGTYDMLVSIVSQGSASGLFYMSHCMPQMMNAVYMAHVATKDQLAAVGMVNVILNTFVVYPSMGFAGGVSTLSSQAYGAGESRLACIYYQRARVISALQCLWIVPVLLLSDVWMIALGQDPIVAKLAVESTRAAAPFAIIHLDVTCMENILMACLRPNGVMAVITISGMFHIVFLHIFVGVCGLGNAGLGLAMGMNWAMRYIMTLYVLWKDAPEIGVQRRLLFCFEAESCSDLCEYIKVAFPIFAQCMMEYGYYEVIVMLAGLVGKTAMAASSITYISCWSAQCLPFGIGVGASVLVGNAIGAGSAELAKKTAALSIGLGLVTWSLVALIACLFSDQFAGLLTNDADIQRMSRLFILTYCASGFFEASQIIMAGILRGLGLVNTPATTYGICYYLIMLPSAILLTFAFNVGVEGL